MKRASCVAPTGKSSRDKGMMGSDGLRMHWAFVFASVLASVFASVGASVGAFIYAPIRASCASAGPHAPSQSARLCSHTSRPIVASVVATPHFQAAAASFWNQLEYRVFRPAVRLAGRALRPHPQHPAVSVNLKHPQDPQQRPFRSIALYRSPAHVPARDELFTTRRNSHESIHGNED